MKGEFNVKFHKNYSNSYRKLLNELGGFLPSNIEAVQSENDTDETLDFIGPVKDSCGLIRHVARFAVRLNPEVRSTLAHACEDDRVSMQEVLAYSLASQIRTLFNPDRPLSNDLDKEFDLIASMEYLDGWIYLKDISRQLSTLRAQSLQQACG